VAPPTVPDGTTSKRTVRLQEKLCRKVSCILLWVTSHDFRRINHVRNRLKFAQIIGFLLELDCLSGDLGIDHGDVLHEVDNTARVTVFVVVPGDKLDEVGVQHDTGISVEDGRTEVTLEVTGDKGLIRVSEESLHVTLTASLDDGADLFVGGGLLELAGQVNNGHINGRDTECHTGDLSNKGRNDLGDSLGGTSRGRNDVARGSTSSTPVLTGRRVDDSLGGGHGMNGGHEGLSDFELVVDALDHRGKSVGGAGCARDEVIGTIVLALVDTHDNGQGVILSGGGVDDLLGTSIDDGLGGVLGEEDTGGLANVVSTEGTPADLLGVAAAGSLDLLSVEDEEVSIDFNSLLGTSVNGVPLVLVRHVVGGGRTSVNGVEGALFVFHHDTGNETSDTSESVDSHTGGFHGHGGIVRGRALESTSREPIMRGRGI
jgi:hypothetical protein